MADVVVIGKGSKVYDGWVDLEEGKVVDWAVTEGVQPLVSNSVAIHCVASCHEHYT